MTDDSNIEKAPGETPAPATLIDIVFPGDTNHHGTLFGGAGLALMDRTAFIVATRHGRVPFVTASCDRVDFHAPAHIGHIVSCSGRPIRVGRRSMVVEVDMIAEDLTAGTRDLCARGPMRSERQKTMPCAWSISSFRIRPAASAPCLAATRWRR